jgi:hypothetical protein
VNPNLEDKTLSVHQDVALSAANLFAAVVTSRLSAHPGSLCGLRVDYPGTGLGVSSEASSQALVDCLVHLFPGAVETPSSEVVVDSLPRREVTGQKPPLAAALQDIENGVQNLAGAVDSRASSPFRGREVGLEVPPFGIGKVSRVPLSHAPERTRSLCSGAFSNSLSRKPAEQARLTTPSERYRYAGVCTRVSENVYSRQLGEWRLWWGLSLLHPIS